MIPFSGIQEMWVHAKFFSKLLIASQLKNKAERGEE